jgi:hypothetical protein
MLRLRLSLRWRLLLLQILRLLAIVELLVPDRAAAAIDSEALRVRILKMLSMLRLLLRWVWHIRLVVLLLLLRLAMVGLPWWHGAPKAHGSFTIRGRRAARAAKG